MNRGRITPQPQFSPSFNNPASQIPTGNSSLYGPTALALFAGAALTGVSVFVTPPTGMRMPTILIAAVTL